MLPCDTAAGGSGGGGGWESACFTSSDGETVRLFPKPFVSVKVKDEMKARRFSLLPFCLSVFFSWSRSLSLLQLWVSLGVLFVSEFVLCAFLRFSVRF